METVQTLIDRAVILCGTQAKAAMACGVSRPRLLDIRAGRRPMTPETLARLCNLLELPGDEARQALAEVECNNPKHAQSREVMRRAFFGCLVAGVALANALPVLTLYTLWSVCRHLLGANPACSAVPLR